jgi:hypothetical protein
MKYVDCNDRMPTSGRLIMAKLRPDDRRCICQWNEPTNSWGAHISVSSWRNLSVVEKLKVKTGILKTYSKMEKE